MARATLAEDATRRPPILDDPFLWLEEVEGKRALEWVKQRNGETLAELQADKRYEPFLAQAEALLNATDRIPYGSIRGRHIYNFWRDAGHVRGGIEEPVGESISTMADRDQQVASVIGVGRSERDLWTKLVGRCATWISALHHGQGATSDRHRVVGNVFAEHIVQLTGAVVAGAELHVKVRPSQVLRRPGGSTSVDTEGHPGEDGTGRQRCQERLVVDVLDGSGLGAEWNVEMMPLLRFGGEGERMACPADAGSRKIEVEGTFVGIIAGEVEHRGADTDIGGNELDGEGCVLARGDHRGRGYPNDEVFRICTVDRYGKTGEVRGPDVVDGDVAGGAGAQFYVSEFHLGASVNHGNPG